MDTDQIFHYNSWILEPKCEIDSNGCRIPIEKVAILEIPNHNENKNDQA